MNVRGRNCSDGQEVCRGLYERSGRRIVMNIVVIGGTGLVGSKLVHGLAEHGHDAVAAAPRRGVEHRHR